MKNKRKYIVILLLIMIVITIAFIWLNSIQGKLMSSDYSNGVYNGVVKVSRNIFGSSITSLVFNIITHAVFRKIAHAFEFMILGIEVNCLFICIKRKKKRALIEIFGFGLVIASLDETIQIFSNRGASVVDVLIDMSGFTFALLMFFLFYWLRVFIRQK